MSFKVKDGDDTVPEDPSSTPTTLVENLPSNFKGYPKDCKIVYSPYTFGELSKFNSSELSEEDRIKLILSGIETSFDKNDLTFADFLYLGFLRKIASLGSKAITVSTHCPSCGESVSFNKELEELEFQELEAELPITLTMSDGLEIEFSPLRVRNYLTLVNDQSDNDEIQVLASQVTNHEFDKALETISKVTNYKDITNLKKIDKLLYHGLKSVDIRCSSCKQKIAASLDGQEGILIYPFRGDELDDGDAIRFGSK